MEEKKTVFDNIDFSEMGIADIINLCLKCQNKEDAKKVMEQYEKYCDTPEIAHSNLGYIFGYCNENDRKKLYSLFPVNHPIFGKEFGRGNSPAEEEAFKIGQTHGEVRKIDEKLKSIENQMDKDKM